ncbi:hypothetical protein KIN20_002824 [Parelaphostrongylus tenuis]|uniref:Uncharacterized protein n=1 Tax=Parelaphostrongylus tenuis TaxID=148309 RepID=A0AAD5QI43_PARTN|nr:hypothetical protein KIN20_002824 [Parelaphostrongylus tenuis]
MRYVRDTCRPRCHSIEASTADAVRLEHLEDSMPLDLTVQFIAIRLVPSGDLTQPYKRAGSILRHLTGPSKILDVILLAVSRTRRQSSGPFSAVSFDWPLQTFDVTPQESWKRSTPFDWSIEEIWSSNWRVRELNAS